MILCKRGSSWIKKDNKEHQLPSAMLSTISSNGGTPISKLTTSNSTTWWHKQRRTTTPVEPLITVFRTYTLTSTEKGLPEQCPHIEEGHQI
jgi:hypothetical protein